MRVVHIGYKYGLNNTGGAAIAATRLHKTLLRHGVESHYVCVWQCEEGKNVHVLPRTNSIVRRLYFFATRCLRGFFKFTHWRKSIPLNIVPMFGLEKLLDKIRPDVVHVHWINADVVSFKQLANIKCKVVVNLHDLFMINIMEPHPGSDKRYVYGLTRENSSLFERWLFNRKLQLMQKLSPVFIGPSKWVCDCAKKSIIGKGCQGYAIPNIIDAAFRCRPELKAHNDKFIILFGAYGGRKNLFKGFSDLERALSMLPERIKDNSELWIFGEEAHDCKTSGVKTQFVGNVSSRSDLVALYNQADVFAFPSVQETQGMTKIEAMLCGLPVIAFDRTACAEGIVNSVSGWVVDDGDVKAFADSLIKQYEMASSCFSAEPICMEIAQRAKAMFGEDEVFSQILKVYRMVVYGRERDCQGNRQSNGNKTEC